MSAQRITFESLSNIVSVPFPVISPESSPSVSPDDRWVAYVTRRTDLEENLYRFSLWCVRSNGEGSPIALLEDVDGGTSWGPPFSFQWAPDSETVAVLDRQNSFRFVTPGGEEANVFDDQRLPGLSPDDVGIITAFKFSPDGKSIAFLATQASEAPLATEAVEIDILKCGVIDLFLQRFIGAQNPPPKTKLWVLDLGPAELRQITNGDTEVNSFSWSRDSQRLLMLAGAEVKSADWSGGEYKVLDVSTLEVRPLNRSTNEKVVWAASPDGNWLAKYPLDRPWHFVPPSLAPSSGEESDFELVEIPGAGGMFWSKDSRSLFFERSHRMGRHLFRMSVESGEFEQMTQELDEFNSGFAAGTEVMSFVRSSVTKSPDVFSSTFDDFEPKRLTRTNPEFDRVPKLVVRRLGWRSPDDRWDIEGFLVLPSDYEEGHRYPLLVEVVGGPSMVMMSFEGGFQFSIPLFAANGYAVLVPNTRGRSGGYDEQFCNAISSEGNQCQGPLLDVMAGVDLVISEGIADPDRLGIMGHSYGGFLTAFAITQTDRFKAASFHEAAVDMVGRQFMDGGNPETMAFLKRITGYGSPYDSEEFERIRRDSALHQIQHAKTPVLIEAGELSGLALQGALLAHGLEHFGVPYEFRIDPQTGHVTTEPKLIEEARRRNLTWFDYWLLDKPYSDSEKQTRYDKWKQSRR